MLVSTALSPSDKRRRSSVHWCTAREWDLVRKSFKQTSKGSKNERGRTWSGLLLIRYDRCGGLIFDAEEGRTGRRLRVKRRAGCRYVRVSASHSARCLQRARTPIDRYIAARTSNGQRTGSTVVRSNLSCTESRVVNGNFIDDTGEVIRPPIADRAHCPIAEVHGQKPLEPVLTGDAAEILPFAMTAPLWIDADGDGRSLGR